MKNSAKVAFAVSSSLFLVGSALAATTAKNYVQNGLVAHWDAIENAGYGQHDNAATAWKDLKGAHDLTIVNSEATWEEAALYPPQKGYSAIAQDLGSPKLTKTSYRTMDVCASYYKAEKCVLGMGARNLSWYDKGFLIRNTTTKYCAADLTVNTPYSICINYAYNDSKPEGCWLDGEPIEESTSAAAFTPLSAADTTFEIGRSVNTYFSSCGRVHAVRLYNRPLETWEAWLNSNLDKVRYNGIDGTTLEWPEGYGFQNGDLCYWVTASVETYSTAESSDNRVAFNGGEAVPSLATWKTDGVACTLTPVPDANHRYCGWTGDTEGLVIDADGVVTLDNKPRTLVCHFLAKGSQGAFRAWTGAAGTADWSDPTNWDPEAVPVEDDILTIPTGASVILGLGESTPKLQYLNCFGTLVMSNWTTRLAAHEVCLRKGATLTCADAVLDGPATTGASYTNQTFSRVWIACETLTVAEGASIDVRLKGWRGTTSSMNMRGYGPGSTADRAASGHGGHGGGPYACDGATGVPIRQGRTYDVPDDPTEPGSSGYGYTYCRVAAGGGVVRIEAAGTVTVDGSVLADGQDADYKTMAWGQAASGGSINLACRDLAGAGIISANGGSGKLETAGPVAYGTAQSSYAAGGGMIAIYYDATVQAGAAVRGMRITAAAGGYVHAGKTVGVVGEVGITAEAGVGTLRFTDRTLVDELLGNGLSGQVVGVSPYVYEGDLAFNYGHVRFADDGADVTVTGDLVFGGSDSRLEIGGVETRKRTSFVDVWAGTNVNKLAVGGNLTLGGVSRLDVRAAETNGVGSAWGATVDVGGAMTVGDGCLVVCWSDIFVPSAPHFTVGSLTVSTDGVFTAFSRGGSGSYGKGTEAYGTSAGHVNVSGGGHGGKGGGSCMSDSKWWGLTNDDALRPAMPGSGGASYGAQVIGAFGGGVVSVSATTGLIRIDGTVTADASKPVWYGTGGAGGTIFFEGAQVQVGETGVLTAKGSNASPVSSVTSQGGGGGRISVFCGQPWSATVPKGRVKTQDEPFGDDAYPADFSFAGTLSVAGGILTGDCATRGHPGEDGTIRFTHVNEAPGSLILVR